MSIQVWILADAHLSLDRQSTAIFTEGDDGCYEDDTRSTLLDWFGNEFIAAKTTMKNTIGYSMIG